MGKIDFLGNPHEEKVSHAGLLIEGSDYIRSLKRENNTLAVSIYITLFIHKIPI